MSKLVLLESLFLINNGWSKLLKNQYVYNPFNTLKGTVNEFSSNPSLKESEWHDSGTFENKEDIFIFLSFLFSFTENIIENIQF